MKQMAEYRLFLKIPNYFKYKSVITIDASITELCNSSSKMYFIMLSVVHG